MFSLPNLLTVIFVLVCSAFTMRHGLWRDEAIAFLMVRDARSLSDLFENLRYGGHPPLWHLMLYPITRWTVRPEAMQVLHVGLAAVSVQLVARYAPFSRVAKILFPFGYFTLFEYGVIARDYQLLLLLSVLFCVLWTRRRRGYVGLGCVLALLCFTHMLGVILAGGFGAMIVYEAAGTERSRRRLRRRVPEFIAGAGIAVVGCALAIQLMIPPADSGFAVDWHFDLGIGHVVHTCTAFWDAYVPIPAVGMHFWNESIVSPTVAGIGGAVAALLGLAAVWRWRGAFLFLVVVDLGTAVFLHAKIFSGWRHAGPLFVALIAAFWMVMSDGGRRGAAAYEGAGQRRILGVALTVMLAMQTCGLAVAGYFAWWYPFSPAREAARFIGPQLAAEDLVVARDDVTICSLAAYLPGREFFFQRGSRWGTFTIYRSDFSKRNSLWWADMFSRVRRRRVLLIMSERLERLGPRMTYAGGYDGGIQGDECYYFYWVVPPVGGRG